MKEKTEGRHADGVLKFLIESYNHKNINNNK